MSMRLVTISAQYGAGGSSIAPAVAEALGVPFVDRAIPVQVARELGISTEESLARDDRAETRWMSRWLAGAARVAAVTSTVPDVPSGGAVASLLSDQAFVAHTEKVIRELADSTGAVILGRAAAVVLRDRPGTLHVRLYGPQERRLRHAMASRGIDAATAQREMADADRARAAYVRRFYRRYPDDARLYHLMCDSTALPPAAVAELITVAARATTTRG
jgi:cytidylate kinase